MPEAHRFEKRQQQEREEGYVFGGADESLGPMQDSAPNVGGSTLPTATMLRSSTSPSLTNLNRTGLERALFENRIEPIKVDKL